MDTETIYKKYKTYFGIYRPYKLHVWSAISM